MPTSAQIGIISVPLVGSASSPTPVAKATEPQGAGWARGKVLLVILSASLIVSGFAGSAAKADGAAGTPHSASAPPPPETNKMESLLEVYSLGSKQRTVIYRTEENIEGAFWSADGSELFFSERGYLHSVPLAGGKARRHDIGLDRLGGSMGYAPDKKEFVVSHYTGVHDARIFLVPVAGGQARPVTANAPSWWHGFSPDGKTILFVGLREDILGIYSISSAGGAETPLTRQAGMINDGPEFSMDGRQIYFNSDRSGRNQIWRMNADGTTPEQVTHDGYCDWYPHVSPDGKWITYLAYEEADVKGHPQYRPVMLRLLSTAGGKAEVLVRLTGGQGTYDTNSWSPDSSSIAFISYRPVRQ